MLGIAVKSKAYISAPKTFDRVGINFYIMLN